ncbi:MAG: hypothetical protein ABI187_10060 [Ornithinibacter sp.]
MFVIDAFGAPWILDLSGLEEPLADSLRLLWSRAVVDTTTTELSESDDVRPFVVARSADGSVTVGDGIHHGSDEHLPYAVSRALTLASLKRRVGDCVLLHAAGAALPDGSTVALVGPSGTGKTTASRALCQTLGYVSDETVAVEESGRVRAWAKPLSVVIDPASRWEKLEHSPDELGLLRAPEALHLVAVIVLDRDPDLEGDPVLEQIGLVDAINDVLPQTSSLLQLESPLSRLSALLTTGSGPWRLTYREVTECIDLVTAVVSGTAPHDSLPLPWEVAGDETVHEDTEGSGRPSTERADLVGEHTVLRRSPYREAVTSEGQAIVLQGQATTLLPGIAAAIWMALDSPRPITELTAMVQADVGEHPQAADLVLAAVKDLVRAGTLAPIVETLTPEGPNGE